MDFNIDYGDIGSSIGVESFLIKKKRRLERLSEKAACLNIDIKKENIKGNDLPESFSVDLEWISRRGVTHFVTGKDRNFFKAAAEAFNLVVKKINRSKKSFNRDQMLDHLHPELIQNA
jgi:hypothetical protein